MPSSRARHQILKGSIRRLRRTLKGISRGKPEAIHAARIATRRLRELVPLLGLSRRSTRRIVRQLRAGGRRLGKVRDVDTQMDLLEELSQLDRASGPLMGRLRDNLGGESADRRRRLARRKLERRLARTLTRLERAVDKLDGKPPGGAGELASVAALIGRRARALKDSLNRAGAFYEPDALHDVRLAVKRLRYAAELSAGETELPGAADFLLLRRTQDVLGRLNDGQVLVDRLRAEERASRTADAAASKEVDRMASLLETHGRRLHARFLRGRPALLDLCERWAPTIKGASRGRRRTGR
jgi:CHAD domain-containing protein